MKRIRDGNKILTPVTVKTAVPGLDVYFQEGSTGTWHQGFIIQSASNQVNFSNPAIFGLDAEDSAKPELINWFTCVVWHGNVPIIGNNILIGRSKYSQLDKAEFIFSGLYAFIEAPSINTEQRYKIESLINDLLKIGKEP